MRMHTTLNLRNSKYIGRCEPNKSTLIELAVLALDVIKLNTLVDIVGIAVETKTHLINRLK